MNNVEPSLLFFFSYSEHEFGVEVYHPFLVGGPIGIICIDGQGEFFFRPMVFGNEVMVDEASSGSGVDESSGVDNLSEWTMVEGSREFHGLSLSTSYKELSNVGR